MSMGQWQLRGTRSVAVVRLLWAMSNVFDPTGSETSTQVGTCRVFSSHCLEDTKRHLHLCINLVPQCIRAKGL